ncbi:promethin-A [Lingula anatina]|uniref:Promethin-A n=1 Tax=Lingula anatina TaxID=7574 RepID=A0A1S3HD61_LINAN|nr:promethin-A [Lingula anatina]XP_013383054.1 promethin-A [Lingula anatina]|eukprot:XP_013382994.1 promethin-A [Lingula anatina]
MDFVEETKTEVKEEVISPAWENLKSHVQSVNEQFQLEVKFESLKSFASAHPWVTLCLAFTLAFCSVPVAVFVCFAVGSVLATLIGFVIFEGTLLAVGAILLGCTVCFTTLISIGLTFFLVTSWIAFNATLGVLQALREYIKENA